MKLNIKLYGTLSRSFDNYDHLSGLEVILPDGTSIHDLLVHLNLLPVRIGMVLMNGKPAQKDTRLENQAQIKFFQPIAGG